MNTSCQWKKKKGVLTKTCLAKRKTAKWGDLKQSYVRFPLAYLYGIYCPSPSAVTKELGSEKASLLNRAHSPYVLRYQAVQITELSVVYVPSARVPNTKVLRLFSEPTPYIRMLPPNPPNLSSHFMVSKAIFHIVLFVFYDHSLLRFPLWDDIYHGCLGRVEGDSAVFNGDLQHRFHWCNITLASGGGGGNIKSWTKLRSSLDMLQEDFPSNLGPYTVGISPSQYSIDLLSSHHYSHEVLLTFLEDQLVYFLMTWKKTSPHCISWKKGSDQLVQLLHPPIQYIIILCITFSSTMSKPEFRMSKAMMILGGRYQQQAFTVLVRITFCQGHTCFPICHCKCSSTGLWEEPSARLKISINNLRTLPKYEL